MGFKAYKIIAHQYLDQGKLKLFFLNQIQILSILVHNCINCQLWNTSKLLLYMKNQISPNDLFVSLSYLGWPMTPNPI